jgi:hypothetical protein
MAKKIKKVVPNYHVKDLVVVRTMGWNKEDVKYEIGMITNVRYATQLTKKTYDIRTEGGSAFIYTSVDEPKSKQTISSPFTNAWIADGGSNNMWIHKRDGHTRANYSENVELRFDGESSKAKAEAAKNEVVKIDQPKNDENKVKTLPPLLVGQFEKYNDFVFPTQGPRSY